MRRRHLDLYGEATPENSSFFHKSARHFFDIVSFFANGAGVLSKHTSLSEDSCSSLTSIGHFSLGPKSPAAKKNG